MESLQDPTSAPAVRRQELIDEARNDVFLHTHGRQGQAGGRRGGRAQRRAGRQPVPAPPFWGTRVLRDIPLDEVFRPARSRRAVPPAVGRARLGRRVRRHRSRRLRADARPPEGRGEGERLAAAAGGVRLLPGADRSGNDLIVYDPAAYEKRRRLPPRDRALPLPAPGRTRAAVPRRLLPLRESGDVDVAGAPDRDGRRRGDAPLRGHSRRAGEYSEAFFAHGIAVETAEAVAEWMHRADAHGARPAGRTGKRYSWGYGACPDLEDHAQLFKLLPGDARR